MDGYAVSRSSILRSSMAEVEEEEVRPNNGEEEEDAAVAVMEDDWTHVVLDRVYSGKEPGTGTTQRRHQGGGTVTSTLQLLLPVAYYVTTGAVIPVACDCVIPLEDVVRILNDRTLIQLLPAALSSTTEPTWIRGRGSDIPAGTVVVPKGSVLDVVALGLILQSGVRTVKVRRLVTFTVAVLSTGNELIDDDDDENANNDNNDNDDNDRWSTLPEGKIPDVNRPVLMSLLQSAFSSCNNDNNILKVVDLGMVRDDSVSEMVDVMQNDAALCDVILTTGGISVGESDRMEQVLVQELQGRLHFGRLHMKPGKPTTFVTLPNSKQTLVFALPGNPLSAQFRPGRQ